MKRLVIALMLCLIGVAHGGECTLRADAGAVVVDCSVSPLDQKPFDLVKLTEMNINSVPAVCAAMRELGFDKIYSIPCSDELVVPVTKMVDGYVYKAIVYRQQALRNCFEDKIAVARLLTAEGQPAPKLTYFKLMLSGKLPYPAYDGTWLPSRSIGVAEEFRFKPGTQVDVVDTLADGRTIKLVVHEGSLPYFAVETTKQVKKKDVLTRQVTTPRSTTMTNRRVFEIPTETTLRARGLIGEGESLLQVLAVDQISDVNVEYEVRTIAVINERTVNQTAMTIYPFQE